MLKVVAPFNVVFTVSSFLFAIKAINLPILKKLTVLRSMGRLLSVKKLARYKHTILFCNSIGKK